MQNSMERPPVVGAPASSNGDTDALNQSFGKLKTSFCPQSKSRQRQSDGNNASIPKVRAHSSIKRVQSLLVPSAPGDETSNHEGQPVELRLTDEQSKAAADIFRSANKKLKGMANEAFARKYPEIPRKPDMLGQDISFGDFAADGAPTMLRITQRRHRTNSACSNGPITYNLSQPQATKAPVPDGDKEILGPRRLSMNQQKFAASRSANIPCPPGRVRFVMPVVLSDVEIATLRKSFDLIKHHAIDLGPLVISKVAEAVPESFGRSATSADNGEAQLQGNQWEFMQQGLMFLNGIERCLLRIKNPESMSRYICYLIDSHSGEYDVGIAKLVTAVNVCGTVLLNVLREKHSHDWPEGVEQVCDTCAVWTKFIGLLSLLLISNGKATDKCRPE